MKRNGYVFLAVLISFFLLSASVWEGSGTVSPAGVLPEAGYYVATNSFPRNTEVDITNLENQKTIRVIVVAGLDSPGLLAMLSKDAAAAIGLSNVAIGRIRMSIPNDPVAFSRFSEDLSRSGDPDHDPKAAVAQDANGAHTPAPAENPVSKGEYLPNNTIVDIPETFSPPSLTEADDSVSPVNPPHAVWVYPEEIDETANGSAGLPGDLTAPETVTGALPGDTGNIIIDDEDDFPEEFLSPDHSLALDSPEGEADAALEEITETEDIAEESPAAEVAEAEIIIGENPAAEISGEDPVPAGDRIIDLAEADIGLVPAEERPPESGAYNLIPGDDEINPLPGTGFSDPVPPAAEYAYEPVPDDKYPETASSYADPGSHRFSVPLIHNLERGKYYLQLGAFSKADSVEQMLASLGKSYPLSVQPALSGSKQVYRILVGPVNLGESAALLQRFKSIGYKDAFIRQES